mgnify:FL=1
MCSCTSTLPEGAVHLVQVGLVDISIYIWTSLHLLTYNLLRVYSG